MSSLSINQLKKVMPNPTFSSMVPKIPFTSLITMSVVYNKKFFKNKVEGFGFLVPKDQQHILPISGCIFDHSMFSNYYQISKIHQIDSNSNPTYSFTV